MKKVSAVVFMIGLTSTAFLAAQRSPGPGSGTIRPVQPGEVGRGQLDMMTVTGCLQRSETNAAASPSAPATSTATQATRTGGSFILTNAKPSDPAAAMAPGSTPNGSTAAPGRAAAPATTAATGTARSGTAGGGAARNYTLIESNTGELGPHLGHLMQITGVIASASAGSSGDGANASGTGSPNSATGGVPDRMGNMMANQRLEVFAIRMISATCPPAPSSPR